MIANEVQYRATNAHLATFDEAATNLEATLAKGGARARLTQLELDAVRSQADDLRAEIEEYDRLRSGAVSAFEAPMLPDAPSEWRSEGRPR